MQGLTEKQAAENIKKYGKNELTKEKKENIFQKLFEIFGEPMFILLIVASIIYFILGDHFSGVLMLLSILFIIFINALQKTKTNNSIKKLKSMSEPKVKVIRDGIEKEINTPELTIGDLMVLYEGVKVAADGIIVSNHGLKVDESILTGESMYVNKTLKDIPTDNLLKTNHCYAGTLVIGGSAIVKVENIGMNTSFGKISASLNVNTKNKTPLQKEVNKIVKIMFIFAFLLCVIVVLLTYFLSKGGFINSLLVGISLAMGIIPEEYPVVLSVFLSLGAYRLSKKNALVKNLNITENLGAISVLCVDKTGTITKNEMTLSKVWSKNCSDAELLEAGLMCSDEGLFDPLERAIAKSLEENNIKISHVFESEFLKFHPFNNDDNIMGSVAIHDKEILATCKGATESIIKLCKMTLKEAKQINEEYHKMASLGLRVIAVCQRKLESEKEIKDQIKDYNFNFLGLLGLIDPPKKEISEDIETLKNAGIRVIMITGDNGTTASNIAKTIGIDNYDKVVTGKMLETLPESKLQKVVETTTVFSRVVPSQKLRIINALKANGEVVGMTGDGVNDAPALRKADIGISMGKKGSDVAREASDLILMDDNFHTIVEAIKDGRRIYNNIKSAIIYILIIHFPLILSSIITAFLKVPASSLMLLPIHIILLELVIDPTSSVILEHIPNSKNIMNTSPRQRNEGILNKKNIIYVLVQGLTIFLISFIPYFYCLQKDKILLGRTLALTSIIISNLILIINNLLSKEKSFKIIIQDKLVVFINLIIIGVYLLLIYTPVNKYLSLTSLNPIYICLIIIVSIISSKIVNKLCLNSAQ